MIAALIFAGIALAAVATFAGIAISLARGKAESDVRAKGLAKDLEVSQANEKTQSARADREEERADGLDALLDEIAANDDPEPARAHVLSRRARKTGTADGGGEGEVLGGGQDPRVASGSEDDLLKPGD